MPGPYNFKVTIAFLLRVTDNKRRSNEKTDLFIHKSSCLLVTEDQKRSQLLRKILVTLEITTGH